MRWVVLLALAVAGVFALFWVRAHPGVVTDPPRLSYVATAHQLGVVGYRDPVGVVSADGALIAFSEGRRLFETATTGGVRSELAAGRGQIRHLASGRAIGDWIYEDTEAS